MTAKDVDDVLATTDASDLPPSLTVIRIRAGEHSDAVDQAEAALLAVPGDPRVMQRGGLPVHIAELPVRRTDGTVEHQHAIDAAEPAALLEAFAAAANFEKFDARKNDWVPTDPPKKIAETYIARPKRRLHDLRQVIGGPTLRADGSLLAAPGYDQATGLFLVGDLPGLAVPDHPSYRQAEAANDMLADLFKSFPFVSDPAGLALSIAMAGLIGAVLRPTLPTAPLIGVSAPVAGSGKSYLVDLIALIATGQRAVGVATGGSPEEFEKSLGTALMDGHALFCLDNLVQDLAGQLICMALSQPIVAVRVLGLSRNVKIPAASAIFATANNLKVRGDMVRRALICRMDPGLERPEAREFDGDLIAEARNRRAELLSAILTIARWGHLKCTPARLGVMPFAGFSDWCRRVRDPLHALGHPDAVMALELTRNTDAESTGLRILADEWDRAFSEAPHTCADAINLVDADLTAAITAVTGDRPGAINSRRLSNYLARMEGRIAGGKRFKQAGKSAKTMAWMIEAVK